MITTNHVSYSEEYTYFCRKSPYISLKTILYEIYNRTLRNELRIMPHIPKREKELSRMQKQANKLCHPEL